MPPRPDDVPRWPADVEGDILSTHLANQPIAPIDLLVRKIDDDHIARLEARFGGQGNG